MRKPETKESISSRFFLKTKKSGQCLVWLGKIKDSGVPVLQVCNKTRTGSQVAWFLKNGAWPDRHLKHLCGEKTCVNIDHIVLGAHAGQKHWVDRFFDRTKKSNSGCLEWVGARKWSGYGHLMVGKKRVTAPQAAWFIANNEWPEGRYVLHSCDNRLCVNIDHLRLGNHYDNIGDMRDRKRFSSGERHWNARVSDSCVIKIKNLFLLGKKRSEIAKEMGLSQSHVGAIINGKARVSSRDSIAA